MDYSKQGGLKPTYGKNKPRNENNGRDNNRGTDKAELLARMQKAAAARKVDEDDSKA